MANQKPGLRSRMSSWFAPPSASSSQPPPEKSSDKQASTPARTNNTSSAAAKQVPNRSKSKAGITPPASTAAQKTPSKPPPKPAQNSKLQPQTTKPKADSSQQARRTSQARPDKSASPTKLNTQQPSTKATPVQPARTSPPQSPSTLKEASPSTSKPTKSSDHEPKSAESSPPMNSPKSTTELLKSEPNNGGEPKPTNEIVSKSSPTINPTNSTTQLLNSEPNSGGEPKPANEIVSKSSSKIISTKPTTKLPNSEPNSGGELKPTNELVSKPLSPKKSPQSATKHTSASDRTITSQNSAIDGEPIAANSSAQVNIPSNEIPRQAKEHIPKIQGDFESTIPTPGSISSNMNYPIDKIQESQLEPQLAKELAKKIEEAKDKEVEKEKNVINELQLEHQSVAFQPKHSNGSTMKNVPKSTPNDNKVTTNDRPQLSRIENIGDEGRQVSVITLAGENRGASMEIGSSIIDQGLPINRRYKFDHKHETTNEENPNKTESNKQNHVDDHAEESDTYINSNIQSINNSIMFNSSITERDPGVHVVRSNKKDDDKKKRVEVAHKAEFNSTNAEKHTYEPPNNIRKRCLRGLLLESSDSDQERPRRHGCRVLDEAR